MPIDPGSLVLWWTGSDVGVLCILARSQHEYLFRKTIEGAMAFAGMGKCKHFSSCQACGRHVVREILCRNYSILLPCLLKSAKVYSATLHKISSISKGCFWQNYMSCLDQSDHDHYNWPPVDPLYNCTQADSSPGCMHWNAIDDKHKYCLKIMLCRKLPKYNRDIHVDQSFSFCLWE